MTYEFLLLTIFGLATYSFFLSRKKAMALNVMDPLAVHSQPHYHGLYSAILTIRTLHCIDCFKKYSTKLSCTFRIYTK